MDDLSIKHEINGWSPKGGQVENYYKLLQANQAGMHLPVSPTPTQPYLNVPPDFKYTQMGIPTLDSTTGQFATVSWMNPVPSSLVGDNPDDAIELINPFRGLEAAIKGSRITQGCRAVTRPLRN